MCGSFINNKFPSDDADEFKTVMEPFDFLYFLFTGKKNTVSAKNNNNNNSPFQ